MSLQYKKWTEEGVGLYNSGITYPFCAILALRAAPVSSARTANVLYKAISSTPHLIIWDRFLHWTLSSLFQLALPTNEPPGTPSTFITWAGLIKCFTNGDFLFGCWGSAFAHSYLHRMHSLKHDHVLYSSPILV